MTPARPVYVSGDTPAKPVLVLHEVFGADKRYFDFARRLGHCGFSVFAPVLFDGAAAWIKRPCLLREFAVLAKNKSSPIVSWLRVLGKMIYDDAQSGEPKPKGIGVIGLCLTGNFALTMMLDKWVVAPIVSEPALPFPPLTHSSAAAMHLSDAEVACIKQRIDDADNPAQILAFRFKGDWRSPAARYDRMAKTFAPGFIGCGHLEPPVRGAHSVLTGGFTGPKAESAEWAFQQVVTFLRQKLDVEK
jgi:dienelactone hydrolase